jgi:hypothetical protein
MLIGVHTVVRKPTTSIEIAGYSVSHPGDAEAPVVSECNERILVEQPVLSE